MIKGETLKLEVEAADAVGVVFRFGGAESRSIAAVQDGSKFAVAIGTADWTVGIYAWQAWATDAGGTVVVIARGSFELCDVLGVGDVRTSARKMVEMIEAMMAGNAAEGVRRYKINNRELERYSIEELLKLLSYWKSQVKKEERAAAGMSVIGARIAVRF